MQALLYNGQLVGSFDLPSFSQNRSFLYADGLFESIRVMYAQPLWSELHFERLQHGCQQLGLQMPFTFLVFEKQLLRLIDACQVVAGARIRLVVWRQEGGFYRPEKVETDWLMELQPLPTNEFQLNSKGLQLGDSKRPKSSLFVPDIKTTNALLYVLAAREAKAGKFDDVFLYHPGGALLESSNSNVFLLKGQRWTTPATDTGCLPGVMRQVMLSLLARQGYEVSEQLLSHADLLEADEVLLTNAIQGLRWVGGWRQKRYFRKESSKLTGLLNQHALSSLTGII
jgi:branched-subunit amino acid aminotransferase/4-amino-4-deoxychorismate lyase